MRDGSNTIPALGAIDLLFDLEADPQERSDLALKNPELVEDLRQEMRRWERGWQRQYFRFFELTWMSTMT